MLQDSQRRVSLTCWTNENNRCMRRQNIEKVCHNKIQPRFIKWMKKQTISFTNSQIKNYLEQTKDYNPIHEGENAIVPGFLILQKLLFELHFTDLLKENKIARVLMDHSCQDKEKEPEEGNREQCNEEQQISSEKKGFVIEMTWKDLLYCNEECTIYRSDAFTLCGKADRRILWICKVK